MKRICNYFNIQVNNPVCILNQDTARNFLHTTDPKKLYDLFLRATRLEEYYEEYLKIRQFRKDIIRLYEEKENVS